MTTPVAGAHYPRSTGEFLSWFRTDDDCLDYLEWLRWPGGFACPRCGHAGGWRLADGRVKCGGCGGRTSVTAGTIFDKTRTPLTRIREYDGDTPQLVREITAFSWDDRA